jgi:hypothetical protein
MWLPASRFHYIWDLPKGRSYRRQFVRSRRQRMKFKREFAGQSSLPELAATPMAHYRHGWSAQRFRGP